MQWVWLGHIDNANLILRNWGCNTDLRPAAVGPYCTPNFSEFRYAFTDAPSPDSPHSSIACTLENSVKLLLFSNRIIRFLLSFLWSRVAGFNLPITMWMRWVWLGHIGKCEPHSSKLGMQYGLTAAGRRSVLHPQFRRMRFAFTDVPEPDSPHLHCY